SAMLGGEQIFMGLHQMVVEIFRACISIQVINAHRTDPAGHWEDIPVPKPIVFLHIHKPRREAWEGGMAVSTGIGNTRVGASTDEAETCLIRDVQSAPDHKNSATDGHQPLMPVTLTGSTFEWELRRVFWPHNLAQSARLLSVADFIASTALPTPGQGCGP